jgi:uncharacterized membrane protein YkoI
MRITTLTAGLVASLALIAAPLGAMDNDHQTVGDKNAKELENVPMKAREALLKEANGREISSVDRKEDDGRVFYQAKFKRDGKDLSVKVDGDGKVVWRSDEAHAGGSQSGAWNHNDADDKADKAKRDAERKADKAQHDAERKADEAKRDAEHAKRQAEHDADQVKRDAEREADKAKREADHAAHGHHHDGDGHLSLDSIPAAARAAIERESAGGRVHDIDRETKDGKTVYEAEVDTADGKEREIKVSEDGTVLKSKLD